MLRTYKFIVRIKSYLQQYVQVLSYYNGQIVKYLIITVQNKNEYHYFWFSERFKEWKEKEREFFNENKVSFVESIDKMVCSF